MVSDHLGNRFPTNKEMLAFHKISPLTFYDRKKKGLTMEQCLSHDVIRETPVGNTYVNREGERFVLCDYKDYRHVTIRFSDGFEKKTSMKSVQDGTVRRYESTHYTLLRKRGEEREQKCGVTARIIEARDLKKGGGITVEFLDDHSRKDCSYRRFREGGVFHPGHKDAKHLGHREGESRQMKCGLKARIIKYRGATDMDVSLSDGSVLKNVAYKSFQSGVLKPETRKQPRKKIGDVVRQASGLDAELLSKDKSRCVIRLSNGNELSVSYDNWRKGRVLATESFTERKNPDELVGKVIRQHCGLDAEVIAARRTKDIDVRFEDGTEVHHIMWSTLENKQIRHPAFQKQKNLLFRGFLLKEKVYTENETVYYSVEKDGMEDVLSLQEIIALTKEESI